MIKKTSFFVTGVALVFAQISPAWAQMPPGGYSHPDPEAASTAAENRSQGPFVAVTRDNVTGGLRSVQQGDNSRAVMDMTAFVADPYYQNRQSQAVADFNRIRGENQSGCAETGEWIRESIATASEAKEIGIELEDLNRILLDLGKAQNRASGLQMGATVVSTGLLCALSAGLYCAAAAATGLGNIFQTGAHKKTQKVDRAMRYVNIKQSQVQIRATLLTMRMNIGWAKTFHQYCLMVFPNDTIGSVPAA